MDIIDINTVANEEKSKLVVRLTTNMYHTKDCLVFKKTIKILKRLSNNDYIFEDCNMVGADEVIPRIINLHELKDGVYEINTCNEKKDWETGYVEEWDYYLTPYKNA
jgi:hypothetical protein